MPNVQKLTNMAQLRASSELNIKLSLSIKLSVRLSRKRMNKMRWEVETSVFCVKRMIQGLGIIKTHV